jgi:hypothetical protein
MERISIFVPFYQYEEFYNSNDFAESFIIESIIDYVHHHSLHYYPSSLSIAETIHLQIQDSAIDSVEYENLIDEYEHLIIPTFIKHELKQLFNSKTFMKEIYTLLLVQKYNIFNILPALHDGMEIILGIHKSVLETRIESI